jgi:hypothetical protein
VVRVIRGEISYDELNKIIDDAEKGSFINPEERDAYLVRAWEASVEQFLDDGILDETEEKRLTEFKNRFSLSQYDLNEHNAFERVAKAAILRDLLNGVIKQRVNVDGNLPINFQKGELLVWAFPDSNYLEDKTYRKFVGSSQGVSIRVMKGVYYRTSAFRGHPVEYTERVQIDTGWVAITNKNFYFAGSKKSFRTPYTKIVSFEPFSDGIGLTRDAASAKPQIFVTGDGWFTYNLVTNLSKL